MSAITPSQVAGRRCAFPARIAFLFMCFAVQSAAHDGEDHTPPPAGTTKARPVSVDGSIFVTKPKQRQLGLRTQIAKIETLAMTLTFNGKVVADPNVSGRVQSMQAGRIEPGPNGFPGLGQQVRKGEVLVWVKPAASSLERGNQQALQAELDAQFAITERRLRRLEQLEGAVPQKEIEAARIELDALNKRRSAIAASLTIAEALRAPVSGVISASAVVAGQVVDARELLFEVIDPTRLAVEALAYEGFPDSLSSEASAQTAAGSIALKFIGAGRQLREQAVPLMFRVNSSTTPLAIGQPMKVIAKTARKVDGVAMPLTALVKNAAGETVVWLHTGAEHFVPRSVKSTPLSADSVLISAGLQDGDRVVTAGGSLLAQMR